MRFPLHIHQGAPHPTLQTLRAQKPISLLLVIPHQADPNPWAEVIGVIRFVFPFMKDVRICQDAAETALAEAAGGKCEAGVVQDEEKRFVIKRKEQMALVVVPIFIFNVNIPPRPQRFSDM